MQVENGVENSHQVQVDREDLGNGAGPEADDDDDVDDDVSEISGLSDVSISGAGRWHPMKGSSFISSFCFIECFRCGLLQPVISWHVCLSVTHLCPAKID